MWRWLHSLPRAVRQQFHGPGASAGVRCEDIHEKEIQEKEKRAQNQKAKQRNSCYWKLKCRKRAYQRKKERDRQNEDKKESGPDSCYNFWRVVQGQKVAYDMLKLGGAFTIAVQLHLGHYRLLDREHFEEKNKARNNCLLPLVLHSIPSSVNCINPQQTRNIHTQCRCPSEDIAEDDERETTHSQPSVNDKPTVLAPDTLKAKPPDHSKKPVLDTGQAVETLDDVFNDFKGLCATYTARGKSIMGLQAVDRKEMRTAARLWEESARLGNSSAKFNLAVCYETGAGKDRDLSEATKLYQAAAEDLHPQAMYNLGVMYMDGTECLLQDTRKGLELISLAADLALPEAQIYLGVYYTEDGSEDLQKSIKYLTMAANQQEPEGQYLLGMCYEHGQGVDMNPCRAAELYSRAAESGHCDAVYSLSVFHRQGLGGLPVDRLCADSLLLKAADLGCMEAIADLEKQDRGENDEILDTGECEIHDEFDTEAVKMANLKSQPTLEAPKEQPSDITYLLKLNNSVSSPCLSNLLRQSIQSDDSVQQTGEFTISPVSNMGTLSQLCAQLWTPRSSNGTPLLSKVPLYPSRVRSSDSESGSSADSGVVFRMGSFDEDEDAEHDSHVGTGSVDLQSYGSLHRRTQTMPDLRVLPCT